MDNRILVLKICSPLGGCLAQPPAMLSPFQEHWAWANFKSVMYWWLTLLGGLVYGGGCACDSLIGCV